MLLSLVACSSVPKDLPVKKHLILPLSAQEQEALETDFIGRMQSFLSGKLPEQK